MITMQANPRPFTGRHMLAVMLAFFGVIIAVNVTMATLARSSWTGVVVQNTYVASQQFNGKAAAQRAQDALGWKASLTIGDGTVRLTLVDREGRSVPLDRAAISFRRPAYAAEDATVALSPAEGGVLAGAHSLRDGQWIAVAEGDAGLDNPYHAVWRLTLKNGVYR